jgi:hypothetical protein
MGYKSPKYSFERKIPPGAFECTETYMGNILHLGGLEALVCSRTPKYTSIDYSCDLKINKS